MEHIPQDYLGGELSGKTTVELRELLERQEKLLKKRTFLKSLPDKGAKVEAFAEKLTQMIKERENRVISHDRLCERITQKPVSRFKKENKKSSMNNSAKLDTFNKLVTQESEMIEPHSGNVSSAENKLTRDKVLLTDLEDSLVRMEISSDGDPSVKYPAGEHLLNFLEKTQDHRKKIPFMLNRELKISKVEDLPPEFQGPGKTQPQKMETNQQKKISTLWQETAVGPLNYKYTMAKEMSLPESMRLQEEQKKKQEESQALFAAGKLAERLNIKMENFNPEGRDMSYREAELIDSEDDLDGVD